MVVLLLSMCGYGVAGALGAIVANEWSDKILKAVNTKVVRDIQIDFGAVSVSVQVLINGEERMHSMLASKKTQSYK